MLQVIRYVNREFINHDFPFMTTCSISYGDFNYEDKKDWRHVRKNCMSGAAYVEAFLDSRLEKPRTKPGQCRLLKRGLRTDFKQLLKAKNNDFRMLYSVRDYYYFYWMLEDMKFVRTFRKKYKNELDNMYDELIELLQNSCISPRGANTSEY